MFPATPQLSRREREVQRYAGMPVRQVAVRLLMPVTEVLEVRAGLRARAARAAAALSARHHVPHGPSATPSAIREGLRRAGAGALWVHPSVEPALPDRARSRSASSGRPRS